MYKVLLLTGEWTKSVPFHDTKYYKLVWFGQTSQIADIRFLWIRWYRNVDEMNRKANRKGKIQNSDSEKKQHV